jgi:hypothetical protein
VGFGFGLTGGGQASGTGFAGGYGPVDRSAYATPVELGFRPWAADFLSIDGVEAYPVQARIDPYAGGKRMRWHASDWDPGLRLWSLPFDPHLTEWLQDVDLAAWSTQAAREFAAQHRQWQYPHDTLEGQARRLVEEAGWIAPQALAWMPRTETGYPGRPSAPSTAGWQLDGQDAAKAWASIQGELDELADRMQDSRAAYLGEAWAQADDIPGYFLSLMGMDVASRPWTFMLMRCGLSIGNVAYMYFKSRFARVRPSTLCPGLVPPFGPPRHPAFPSGHAFLGHFVAASLLQVPDIAARFGVGMDPTGKAGLAPAVDWYRGAPPPSPGPLMWLAARLARNRELIGVHYASDSAAGRSLAGGILEAIMTHRVTVPAFHQVLARASAEWSVP